MNQFYMFYTAENLDPSKWDAHELGVLDFAGKVQNWQIGKRKNFFVNSSFSAIWLSASYTLHKIAKDPSWNMYSVILIWILE